MALLAALGVRTVNRSAFRETRPNDPRTHGAPAMGELTPFITGSRSRRQKAAEVSGIEQVLLIG